jgi:cytochrome c peroxidase
MHRSKAATYATIACLTASTGLVHAQTPVEQLGRAIFFDSNLSANGNQSCATCHAPESGWTGADPSINAAGAVYEGSVSGRFGNRKPPSSAYATFSSILHYVTNKKAARFHTTQVSFSGGNFWDGRATGEKLGSPAADQAQGPFLNPLEQALSSPADVVSRVCESSYGSLFQQVWGADMCIQDKVDAAFDNVARSIAAYEASSESNAFTSKYDYYLKGAVDLSHEEKKGLALFKGKAQCSSCHSVDPGPNGEPPLLTDFSYDNLGVPRNPENPFYAQTDFNPSADRWIDLGLGGFLASRMDYERFASDNNGKQKVPTLRNVDKRPYDGFTKAYTHNGYFKSLKGVVHFYNTRDTQPACVDAFTKEADALAQHCWPTPEVPVNVNRKLMGDLHLTEGEEDAIVAFLKTLSDGYQP